MSLAYKENNTNSVDVERAIINLIGVLLRSRPEVYAIIAPLEIIVVSDERVPTAATDGVRIFVNRGFAERLLRKSDGYRRLAALLLHEGVHALYGHPARIRKIVETYGIRPEIILVAADAKVDVVMREAMGVRNDVVDENGVTVEKFIEMLKQLGFDESTARVAAEKWSLERIAEELVKEAEKRQGGGARRGTASQTRASLIPSGRGEKQGSGQGGGSCSTAAPAAPSRQRGGGVGQQTSGTAQAGVSGPSGVAEGEQRGASHSGEDGEGEEAKSGTARGARRLGGKRGGSRSVEGGSSGAQSSGKGSSEDRGGASGAGRGEKRGSEHLQEAGEGEKREGGRGSGGSEKRGSRNRLGELIDVKEGDELAARGRSVWRGDRTLQERVKRLLREGRVEEAVEELARTVMTITRMAEEMRNAGLEKAVKGGFRGGGKLAGIGKGGLVRRVEELARGRIDWRRIVTDSIHSLKPRDVKRSWSRLNRKLGPVRPGVTPIGGIEEIIAAIDISGSISNHEYKKVAEAIVSATAQLRPKTLRIIWWDYGVRRNVMIRSPSVWKVKREFAVGSPGGGGTSITETLKLIDKIVARSPREKIVVIASDFFTQEAPNVIADILKKWKRRGTKIAIVATPVYNNNAVETLAKTADLVVKLEPESPFERAGV